MSLTSILKSLLQFEDEQLWYIVLFQFSPNTHML